MQRLFYMKKKEERKLYYTKEPMDMDDYKEEDTTLPPNQINTIDLFLAFHAMLEKKKIASLLKQLLLVTMFPSKKNHRYFRAYASSTEREGSVV